VLRLPRNTAIEPVPADAVELPMEAILIKSGVAGPDPAGTSNIMAQKRCAKKCRRPILPQREESRPFRPALRGQADFGIFFEKQIMADPRVRLRMTWLADLGAHHTGQHSGNASTPSNAFFDVTRAPPGRGAPQ